MAKNVRMKLTEDNILVLRIDMNVEGEESSTGKSHILASSERFEDLGEVDESLEGCTLNLMVLRVKPKNGKRKRNTDELDDDAGDDTIQRTSKRRDRDEPRTKRKQR